MGKKGRRKKNAAVGDANDPERLYAWMRRYLLGAELTSQATTEVTS